MPDLPTEVCQDIQERLSRYIASRDGYDSITYIAAGGSAATYSVMTPHGKRAIKGYDPKFLSGDIADSTRRRLDLQRSLIGHSCEQLVIVYSVDESEGTAFVEMEFVEWPRLKDVTSAVPDSAVSTLIQQLVSAVTYLEKLEIVHRDIKPENIHVSPDFSKLSLLDLGVARKIGNDEDDSGQGTDHGETRPFISTAQYSSPEYLFRLDEPSPTLWKALNIYQVGAVLHDLINKRPLFQEEVDKGNRWLLARAVLEKTPSFPDADPARLARQKALAARCLAKDGNVRLQIASWSDFDIDAPADGVSALHARLSKIQSSAGAMSLTASERRIEFERTTFMKRLCDSAKIELISSGNSRIRIKMHPLEETSSAVYVYEVACASGPSIVCNVSFDWGSEINTTRAAVMLQAALCSIENLPEDLTRIPITEATIGASEEISANILANKIADITIAAIDVWEANQGRDEIHEMDLLSAGPKGEEL
ncbi:protein kinase [Xanthomonas prunicola]|uniref:protein kinase domain-containing protein n=1 Tax=Xanthomonas prunicola TaxID=2053930 RepID=UPI0021B4169C|nr:protein kinase [Xanthomonas prunicola]UXA54254.1 protein kinase [Xanthomonas prunicola]